MLHISVTKRCLSRDWSILKCGGGKRVFLQDTWHSHFSPESNNKYILPDDCARSITWIFDIFFFFFTHFLDGLKLVRLGMIPWHLLSHCHTITLSSCDSVTLPCHNITQLHRHIVTTWHCTVTLSHIYTVLMWQCHTALSQYSTIPPSQCATVTLSHCRTVTLIESDNVTLHRHTVKLSHCYPVIS